MVYETKSFLGPGASSSSRSNSQIASAITLRTFRLVNDIRSHDNILKVVFDDGVTKLLQNKSDHWGLVMMRQFRRDFDSVMRETWYTTLSYEK